MAAKNIINLILENDIGETSNYDIGNIITCSDFKNKGGEEEGHGTKGSKKGIEHPRTPVRL